MQGLSKQTGGAAADDGQEKRLHGVDGLWQWRRERSVMIVEAPVAFPPPLDSLSSQLLAKVFAHEGVRVHLSRVIRVFARQEPGPP